MEKLFLPFILGLLCSSALAQENTFQKIDGLLETELNKENIQNVFLSIYSPSRNFEWHFAKGEFKDGNKVTIENPFYTASIGKTFTATAIGILVDKGEIDFDDPIANYLSDDIMDSLHIFNGVDYGDSISVSHLLQHTSGLPDYFEGNTLDGSPSILDLIMTEPARFWEPDELVAFSKAHFKPSFAPGDSYYYTDTEYVLLGMIVERISGLKLHQFFEEKIFNPLKMKSTYMNQRSTAISEGGSLAEIYASEYEISSFKSLSADWAGGAIVSTGEDLIIFLSALMNGKLVSDTTLDEMQQWTEETVGMTYGYGLRKINFHELDTSLPQLRAVGHSGANGSSMYYCPDLNVYLAGTLNQLEASKDAVTLMAQVLMLCME